MKAGSCDIHFADCLMPFSAKSAERYWSLITAPLSQLSLPGIKEVRKFSDHKTTIKSTTMNTSTESCFYCSYVGLLCCFESFCTCKSAPVVKDATLKKSQPSFYHYPSPCLTKKGVINPSFDHMDSSLAATIDRSKTTFVHIDSPKPLPRGLANPSYSLWIKLSIPWSNTRSL